MKYDRLDYTPIISEDEFRFYMEKNCVVLFEDKYYMYKGEKNYYLKDEHISNIVVMSGRKTLKTIKH